MLRFSACLAGALLILFGVFGLLPHFVISDKVFGLFPISFANSIFYIVLGCLAFISGFKSTHSSRFFFISAGLLFAVIAMMGFYGISDSLFYLFRVNFANNWLHVILAILFFYSGIAF